MIYTAQAELEQHANGVKTATGKRAWVRCLVAACDPARGEDLRRELRSFRRPRVTAECAPAQEMLTAIGIFRPQVVVLEIDHADVDPLAVTKYIRITHPNLPIMISTGQRDAMLASRLLRSGAQGYILHSDWPGQGARALRLLVQGACYVTECVMQEILQHLGEIESQAAGCGLQTLTDRELIVYQFIGQGHPCGQIARELKVTARTVATHRSNIKRKMNLNTDGDLLASAQQWVNQRNG